MRRSMVRVTAQRVGCSFLAACWLRIIYLVRAVLSSFALQVAGEVSIFTVLHNHHQRPYGERGGAKS